MIPKIIHYCWFGGNPLPELAQKCIASWRKFFPGYEIKEWNETNYDVYKIPYISDAYNAKKYAFVSDYARFDIVYNYGGIYFDTDVEVIKPFDDILDRGGFMGFEDISRVNPGLGIGCSAGLNVFYQIMQFYTVINFINKDGSYNFHTVVEYVTSILKQYGLKVENVIQELDGLIIYPCEYFAPKSPLTGKLVITNNTYSIHHYSASWVSENEKAYYKMKQKLYRIFGNRVGMIFSFPAFVFLNIKNHGLKTGIKNILNKLLQIN
jgi:hypothetical protein